MTKYRLNKARNFILSPRIPFLFLLFFSPFVFFSVTLGITISEYNKKIGEAIVLTDDLIYFEGEGNSDHNGELIKKEVIKQLRQVLPSRENVEVRNGRIETDNKWLQDRLNDYEKEEISSKKKTILLGIRERLLAIEQKINELETQSASNRSKDEDKRKLNEILSRAEYRKPEKQEESFFQKLAKKLREWLKRNAPVNPRIPKGTTTTFEPISTVLQILLYVLIFIIIGFIIYKLLPFIQTKFKTRKKPERNDRVILGERIAANESPESVFSEAEKLAREGNLRGAIRKGYIALLFELSDRKIIGLAHHKTNRDYLRDVRKNRNLYENVNGLTGSFERHWYGFKEATQEDWEEFRQNYNRTLSAN